MLWVVVCNHAHGLASLHVCCQRHSPAVSRFGCRGLLRTVLRSTERWQLPQAAAILETSTLLMRESDLVCCPRDGVRCSSLVVCHAWACTRILRFFMKRFVRVIPHGVCVVQGGRDPRTGEPVYIGYSRQFGEPPAAVDAAVAPAGSTAAVKPANQSAGAAGDANAADGLGVAGGGKKRGRPKKAAAASEGAAPRKARGRAADAEDWGPALGKRERRLLGGDIDDFADRGGGGGSGCGSGRRMEWAEVGQRALPAGQSTFARTRPTAVHAIGGAQGAIGLESLCGHVCSMPGRTLYAWPDCAQPSRG